MRCPGCHCANSEVIDSRKEFKGILTRRRRQCRQCGKRFNTLEIVEEEAETVLYFLKQKKEKA